MGLGDMCIVWGKKSNKRWWTHSCAVSRTGRGVFFVDVGEGILTIPTGSNGDARPHAAAVTLTLTRGFRFVLLFLKRVRLVVSPSSGKQHKLLPCFWCLLCFVRWKRNHCDDCVLLRTISFNFLCSSTYFLVVARISTHLILFSDQPLSCADLLELVRTTLSTAYARDGPRRLVMSDNTSHIHARIRCDDLFFFLAVCRKYSNGVTWWTMSNVFPCLHHISYSL